MQDRAFIYELLAVAIVFTLVFVIPYGIRREAKGPQATPKVHTVTNYIYIVEVPQGQQQEDGLMKLMEDNQ